MAEPREARCSKGTRSARSSRGVSVKSRGVRTARFPLSALPIVPWATERHCFSLPDFLVRVGVDGPDHHLWRADRQVVRRRTLHRKRYRIVRAESRVRVADDTGMYDVVAVSYT